MYNTAETKKDLFFGVDEEYNWLNDLVLIGAKCENLSSAGELTDETDPKPGLVWEKGRSYRIATIFTCFEWRRVAKGGTRQEKFKGKKKVCRCD